MIRHLKAHRPWLLSSMLAFAALFSVGCERDEARAEWWNGEQERIELCHQVELMQYRLDHSQARQLADLERLDHGIKANDSLLHSLRQQHSDLSADLEKLEMNWSDFKSSIIREQRQLAMGKTYQTLQLSSGRKFEDVSVMAIHDAGVTIRHSDGCARLSFEDLDSGQQLFFGLEKHLAVAAVEKESLAAAAYEQGFEKQMAAIHQQEKLVAEITKREDAAARQKWSQIAAQYVAASKPSVLSQAATPIGRRSWSDYGYYPYYRYRTHYPYYRSVYYYNASSYNYCRTPVSSPVIRPTVNRRVAPVAAPKKVSVVNHPIRSPR